MHEMKQLPIWVCWRNDPRHGKIPINPLTGGHAQSNNPKTWATYEQASNSAIKYHYDGISFALTDDICGIDIDAVKGNPEREKLAKEIIALFNTYTEYSPSGQGYHIILRYDPSKIPEVNGRLDPAYYQKNQYNKVECYLSSFTSRFFTYTGKAINHVGIETRTEQLLTFLNKYMLKKSPPLHANAIGGHKNTLTPEAKDVISLAEKAGNRNKFITLFRNGDISEYGGDDSCADIALCQLLAFWCGNRPNLIDEIFRQSALYREKWEREDYRTCTIEKAIINQGNVFYKWSLPKGKSSNLQNEIQSFEAVRQPGAIYLNPFETWETTQRYSMDDMGAGNFFADVYKNLARFVPEAKMWYIYNGQVWQPDECNVKVSQFAKNLVYYMHECLKYISDSNQSKAWHKFVSSLGRKQSRDSMLKDAEGVHSISALDFDKDPFLFNCQNGTYDLQTFTLHKHRPDDFLSKIANVTFDANAKCERWEKFIAEIMSDDTEKATFLHKALGYTLTGDISHECFFVLYGSKTRNGKSTLLETTLHLLGDYGKTAQPETIAKKHYIASGAPSEDLARLRGARFVSVSELDKNLVLNTAQVKQMTGGDTITARNLYQSSIEYLPTYKIYLNTNYLPRVYDDTVFASGRVKVIPFEQHFEVDKQDKGLKTVFKIPANASGIYNWLIQGLKLLQNEGLEQPQSVETAIAQYQMDSDIIGQFMSEWIVKAPTTKTPMVEVYAVYKTWCDMHGYSPISNRTLIAELRHKNMEIRISNGNKSYLFEYSLADGSFEETTDDAMNAIFDYSAQAELDTLDLSEFD